MSTWPDCDQLCREVSEESDGTVLVSFSTGKDSLGVWLQVRRFFPNVIPYHLVSIPGLTFVEETLDHYERFFGQKIMRITHPSLYTLLNAYTWQTPRSAQVIYAARLPHYEFEDVHYLICDDKGLDPHQVFTGVGLKQVDGLYRRTMIDKYGPINRNTRKFYPVYDWTGDRLLREIEEAGCGLPVDYQMFGRSFDGLQYAYIKEVKKRFPLDYAKIVEWFPLIAVEIERFEHGHNQTPTGGGKAKSHAAA